MERYLGFDVHKASTTCVVLSAQGKRVRRELMELIRGFLMPPCQALAAGEEFRGRWPPGGPWKEPEDA
ncbi:MAG: hypothetical protein ACRD2Z_08050 [Thermoanaerobaculia bacterium]